MITSCISYIVPHDIPVPIWGHLVPQKYGFPPKAIDNSQLLLDVPIFLMLQLLQPGVVHQIRVLTLLAFIPLNLKQYILQHT